MFEAYAQGGVKKAYTRVFRIWIETICQAFNIWATVRLCANFAESTESVTESEKLLELIIIVRLLKMLNLLYEVRSFRIILETIRYMLEPITSLFIVTTMILFCFALLGMYLFGGLITNTSPVL